MCVFVQVCFSFCVWTCMRVCLWAWVCVFVCVCVCVQVNVSLLMCVCVCMCVCVRTSVYYACVFMSICLCQCVCMCAQGVLCVYACVLINLTVCLNHQAWEQRALTVHLLEAFDSNDPCKEWCHPLWPWPCWVLSPFQSPAGTAQHTCGISSSDRSSSPPAPELCGLPLENTHTHNAVNTCNDVLLLAIGFMSLPINQQNQHDTDCQYSNNEIHHTHYMSPSNYAWCKPQIICIKSPSLSFSFPFCFLFVLLRVHSSFWSPLFLILIFL